jgi:hypothetical protein
MALEDSEHWRLSWEQLELARYGPDEGSGEAVRALWQEWNSRYGFRWRLQNECPSEEDEWALDERFDGYVGDAELVGLVEEAVADWDGSIPNPPGWEDVGRMPEPATIAEVVGVGPRVTRLACGRCGSKLAVLPGSVSAAVAADGLAGLRESLGEVRDLDGFLFALADSRGHFTCPVCGEDQYEPTLADS